MQVLIWCIIFLLNLSNQQMKQLINLLEIQNKALDTPEFESLQSSVAFKLKPALDITMP